MYTPIIIRNMQKLLLRKKIGAQFVLEYKRWDFLLRKESERINENFGLKVGCAFCGKCGSCVVLN